MAAAAEGLEKKVEKEEGSDRRRREWERGEIIEAPIFACFLGTASVKLKETCEEIRIIYILLIL